MAKNFGYFVYCISLLYSCSSTPKQTEDVFAICSYGWKFNMNLGDQKSIQMCHPNYFFMFYHDSIFVMKIDSNEQKSYFTQTIDPKYKKQFKKDLRSIQHYKQPQKEDDDDYRIWGCGPPMYFLSIEGKKTDFGMCSSYLFYHLFRSLNKEESLSEHHLPSAVMRYFYQLNAMRSDFERSDDYPFETMVEVQSGY